MNAFHFSEARRRHVDLMVERYPLEAPCSGFIAGCSASTDAAVRAPTARCSTRATRVGRRLAERAGEAGHGMACGECLDAWSADPGLGGDGGGVVEVPDAVDIAGRECGCSEGDSGVPACCEHEEREHRRPCDGDLGARGRLTLGCCRRVRSSRRWSRPTSPARVAGPGRPRRRPAGDAAGLLDDLDVVRDVRIVAAGGGADRFDGRMDAVGSGTNVTDSQVRAGTGVTTGRAARIAWHRAALSRWPAAFRGLARSSRRGYGRCIWPSWPGRAIRSDTETAAKFIHPPGTAVTGHRARPKAPTNPS